MTINLARKVASGTGGGEFPSGASVSSVGTKFFDQIGIGTTSPQKELHVFESAVNGTPNADAMLVLEGSGSRGLNILCPTTGVIAFGDASDASISSIQYEHAGDDMKFYTGGAGPYLTIDSGGLELENGGSSLNHYEEQTISKAWTNANSGTLTGHATRIGNVVTVLFDTISTLTATAGGTITAVNALNTNLRPTANVNFLYRMSFNGGALTTNTLRITPAGTVTLYRSIVGDNFGAADTILTNQSMGFSFIVD